MIFNSVTIKETKKAIGALCKQRRKAYGLSQEELGKALGLSRFTIQKLESGQNATLDTVLKITNHFELLEQLNDAIKSLQADNDIESMY